VFHKIRDVFFDKRKRIAALSLIAIFIASIVYVACSSDNGTGNPNPGNNTNAVSIEDNLFNPANITISKGTKVTWTWRGSNMHSVTSGMPADANPGTLFDHGPVNSGAFQFTFNNTGTFNYFCRVHGSAMTGTVTVQ
jgi:plastocyanin